MFGLYVNQDVLALLSQTIPILVFLFFLRKLPIASRVSAALMELSCAWGFALILLHIHLDVISPSPLQKIIQIAVWGAVSWAPISAFPIAYFFLGSVTAFAQEVKIVTWAMKSTIISIVLLSLLCYWAKLATVITVLQSGFIALTTLNSFWVFIVFGRRIILHDINPERAWFYRLLKPVGTQAVALQHMALALLSGLLAVACLALWEVGVWDAQVVRLWFAYTMNASIVLVLIVYMHYTDEEFSFLIKLVGASFLTILVILGFVGLLLAPTFSQLYRPPSALQSHSRLRFQRDTDGAYMVQIHPFDFTAAWGERLPFDGNSEEVPLPFALSFYEGSYDRLTINRDGIITLGGPFAYTTFVAHQQPAIMPLLSRFIVDKGNIFVKEEDSSVTITWQNMLSATTGEASTFQVVLHQDGTIDFAYADIAPSYSYSNDPLSGIWLVGLLPGNSAFISKSVQLSQDVVPIGGPGKAIVQNYYLDYRYYLHQQMYKLVFLILGVTIFTLVGFPLLFHYVLIQPLRLLVAAMRRVNHKDLPIEIPIRHNDEIGFLSTSFNQMVRSLQESRKQLEQSNVRLEEQVYARTAELVESNQQLVVAKEEAEAASRAKSQFLTNMSHELRTPLNAILGYTQLWQRNDKLSAKVRKQVAIVDQSGLHLLALINDLLDLAKIEAEQVELTTTPVNLRHCIADVVSLMRVQADKKDLSLLYNAPVDMPTWVLADERRLRQLLLNLLSNAIKFTDGGQVELYITATSPVSASTATDPSQSYPSRYRFSVIDSGIGIIAEEQAAIFQPFTQLGATKSTAGMGLGLAICARLVQLMDGKIGVESDIGKGSTFWFELELPPVPAQINPVVADTHKPQFVTGYDGPRRTILVADDVPEIRMFLRDFLESLNFHVVLAVDGYACIEAAQQHRIDLMILDLMMPGFNGIEVMEELRRQPAWAKMPVIIMSATASSQEQVVLQQSEHTVFLLKPLVLDLLCQHLSALLDITWRYAEPMAATVNSTSANLLPLPHKELALLYTLALRGDIYAISAQISALAAENPAYSPFVEHIHRLAEDLQIEKITELICELLLVQQADLGTSNG